MEASEKVLSKFLLFLSSKAALLRVFSFVRYEFSPSFNKRQLKLYKTTRRHPTLWCTAVCMILGLCFSLILSP